MSRLDTLDKLAVDNVMQFQTDACTKADGEEIQCSSFPDDMRGMCPTCALDNLESWEKVLKLITDSMN